MQACCMETPGDGGLQATKEVPTSEIRGALALANMPSAERAKVFEEAAAVQQDQGGTAGARHAHLNLHAHFWGVSKQQLKDFVDGVAAAIESKLLVNTSLAQLTEIGHPERYYDDAKFYDPGIGPNMHIVNNRSKQLVWIRCIRFLA